MPPSSSGTSKEAPNASIFKRVKSIQGCFHFFRVVVVVVVVDVVVVVVMVVVFIVIVIVVVVVVVFLFLLLFSFSSSSPSSSCFSGYLLVVSLTEFFVDDLDSRHCCFPRFLFSSFGKIYIYQSDVLMFPQHPAKRRLLR